MVRLFSVLGAAGLLLVLSGCRISDDPPAPPAPPTIVNVTPPASDSGLSVLLTLSLGAAVILLLVLVGVFLLWVHERGRRQYSEDLVIELSGLPVARARAALVSRDVVVQRTPVQAQMLDREERRELQS